MPLPTSSTSLRIRFHSTGAGTKFGWPLRLWFAVELFFAVSATLTVGLRPADTANSFAWTIKPEVMAAFIGSFYMALGPVLILALFAKRWEGVRVFVLPGAIFTFTQLVVTAIYWERFAVGTPPFWIWLASYLLPPPVFVGCYLWQERRARTEGTDLSVGASSRFSSGPLPRWLRRGLVLLGMIFTVEAAAGLASPAWFSSWAPWKVGPLNARALGGYYLLLGLLMLSAALENDVDRARLISPFLILLLPVVAVQVRRFPEQVDWTHPRLWIVAALLAAVAVLGVGLFRGSWPRTLGKR